MNFPSQRVKSKIVCKKKRIKNLESKSSFQISEFLRKNYSFATGRYFFRLRSAGMFHFPVSCLIFERQKSWFFSDESDFKIIFWNFVSFIFLRLSLFLSNISASSSPNRTYCHKTAYHAFPNFILSTDEINLHFCVLVEVRFSFFKNPVSQISISCFPFSLSQIGRKSISCLFLLNGKYFIIPKMDVAKIAKIGNSNIFFKRKSRNENSEK